MFTLTGPALPASSPLATALQEANTKAMGMVAEAIEEMVSAWIVETGQGCVIVTSTGRTPVEVALDYASIDLTPEIIAHAEKTMARWAGRTPLRATEAMIRYGIRDLVFYVEVVPFERD